MRDVTIYTTRICPYCVRAKSILARHGVPFTEIDVTGDDALRRELVDRTGMMTVPQIFFGEEPVGGYQDLEELVGSGRLMEKLAG